MKPKTLRKKMIIGKETISNLQNVHLDSVKGGTDVSDAVGVVCYPDTGTNKTSCSYYPVKCPPGWYTVPPCEG